MENLIFFFFFFFLWEGENEWGEIYTSLLATQVRFAHLLRSQGDNNDAEQIMYYYNKDRPLCHIYLSPNDCWKKHKYYLGLKQSMCDVQQFFRRQLFWFSLAIEE